MRQNFQILISWVEVPIIQTILNYCPIILLLRQEPVQNPFINNPLKTSIRQQNKMQQEEKRHIKYSELPSKQISVDSIPNFSSLKPQQLVQLPIWKKLSIEILSLLPTKTPYYLCRLRQTSDLGIVYFLPFQVKKLTDDTLELPTHKTSQLATHLHTRIFTNSPQKEGILIDNRHNIGVYYCYFVIGRCTLEEYVKKQKGTGERLVNLCRELIGSVFEYHTECVVLNCVGLEDIVVTQDEHFFILQNSKSMVIRLDQTTSQTRQTQRFPSPFTTPQCNQPAADPSQPLLTHNPFKSDIYNLGRILQHLFSISSLPFSFPLQQCLVIEQRSPQLWIQSIPNLLDVMLQPQQQLRWSSMELMLYLNSTDWLQKRIEVPYERFFEKKVSKMNAACNQVKVQYQQEQIVFEGEVQEEVFAKGDQVGKEVKGYIPLNMKRGMLYYQGEKVYEGDFKDNRPHGKCKLALKGNWHFEGQIDSYKLHGPGVIYWTQDIVYKGDFYKNILLNRQPNTLKILQHFSYCAQKYSQCEYKLFCRPLTNSPHYAHFNFTSITSQLILTQLFKYLNLKEKVKEIQLKEAVLNNTYSVYLIDVIGVVVQDQEKEQRMELEFACQRGFGRTVFTTLLSENLEKIDISNCRITDEDFKTLLLSSSLHLPNLLQLNFSNTLLRDNSFITFLTQKRQLTKLNISNTKITDHGLTMLLHSESLKIVQLKIGGLKIQNYSVVGRLLSHYKSLQAVEVEGLKIDSTVLKRMVENTMLRSLNLGRCPMLTDKTLEEFFGEVNWGTLRELVLNHNNIGSKVLEVICSMNKSCSQLHTLSLSGCLNIKPSALRLIFRPDRFPSLRVIDVSSTLLSDQCLKDLSDQPTNKLTKLNIASCSNITTSGVRLLLTCDMPDLESLDISRLRVKPIVLTTLQNSHLTLKEFSCFAIEGEDLGYLGALQRVNHIKLESCQLQKNSLEWFGWVKKISSLKVMSLWVDEEVAVSLVKQYGESINLVFKNIEPQFEPLKPAVVETISKETQDFMQLSKSELFEKVETLDLSKQFNLDERRLGSVFNTPYAKNIKIINISQSCLGSKFLDALLLNRLLPRAHHIQLKRLNLSNIKDNIDDIMCKLTRSGMFDKLQVLDLSWTNIHNCVVQTLSTCQNTSLKQISLNNTPYLTDQALQSLFSSPLSQSLALIDLKYTHITNRSLQSLSVSKYCHRLSYLYLTGCDNLNMSGLKKYLVKATSLVVLDLGWVKLDNTVFEILANNLKIMLKKLVLTGAMNCWESLEKYIESRTFQNLETLDLSFSTVKDKYLLPLLMMRHKLTAVNLSSTLTSQDFRGKLQQILENVRQKKKKRTIIAHNN